MKIDKSYIETDAIMSKKSAYELYPYRVPLTFVGLKLNKLDKFLFG